MCNDLSTMSLFLAHIDEGARGAGERVPLVARKTTRNWAEETRYNPIRLFDKVR